MPSLGAGMEAGTLVEWLVKPGDKVDRGDIVAVVETEKGAIEVEIFKSGVIEDLVVKPGEEVPVGTVLARVREEKRGAVPKAVPKRTPKPVKPKVEGRAGIKAKRPTPHAAAGRTRASPAARKRAAELGLDLAVISGTGLGGAIALADVEAAASGVGAKPKAKAPKEREHAMRQAIGAAMARSKHEIPHYYLGTTVDMTRALAWLERENKERPVPERLLYAVLLLKAVALSLRKVSEFNGFWFDGAFHPSADIHVGAAIALRQGGLVAPAIRDTDKKDLGSLMREFRDLVKRVRAGRLRSSEMSAPTITVTSLGERGVETIFPVIYPPQVAIVGFGAIFERPWPTNGAIALRKAINSTLAADHRVSDGHRGGIFLATVDRYLQEPEKL